MTAHSDIEFLAGRLASRSDFGRRIDLRICDVLAAFLAGLHTSEGAALARLHAKTSGSFDAVAAVSAIVRQSESDDIELTSCVTPGSVVIPIALAHGHQLSSAAVAGAVCRGYEAGIIAGRAIGGARALPKIWPTLLAAPVMAAVTLSCLHGADEKQLGNAIALALSGANGRAGRPQGARSGRWVAFAGAVTRGIAAADAANAGFHGDLQLCAGDWWDIQAGNSEIVDRSVFVDPVWPDMDDTDFKPFPIARQGATAIEAFQHLLAKGVDPAGIHHIEAVVPRMNAAMLSRPAVAGERTSLLCNLGFQFACAAHAPDLLYDPERKGAPPELFEFSKRVTVTPTDEFDDSDAWPVRIIVQAAGHIFVEALDQPKLAAAEVVEGDLHEKWARILGAEDRRDFFESVVGAGIESRAMLWDWVKHRLVRAAK